MAYNLKRLRSVHSIPMDDMVSVLREQFPRMDKPLLSKAISGKYGIRLSPDAVQLLGQTFDPKWEKRRSKDRHTLRDSVRCRMTAEEFAAFTEAWQSAGYASANVCVHALIQRYIEERREIRDLLEEERREREKHLWENLSSEN